MIGLGNWPTEDKISCQLRNRTRLGNFNYYTPDRVPSLFRTRGMPVPQGFLPVAETIRLAYEGGLVGGSIEDATDDPSKPIYDYQYAVERMAAAVEAARSCPFHFTLVGRAENFLYGRPDLDDTIRRLQGFEAAGADILYAPGLSRAEDIRTVCASLSN